MVLDLFTRTLNNTWPIITIFLCVIISTRLVYIIINKEKVVIYKEVLTLLFIIYILLLFGMLTATDTNVTHGMNLKPFNEITRYKFGSYNFNINVFGNIIIFIPFGIFTAQYIKSKKTFPVFFISAFVSTMVEAVQLKIGRSFDIDDIILNVLGSLIGYLIYIGLNSIRNKLPKILQRDFIYNILSIIVLVLIVLWLAKKVGVFVL